MGGVEAVRASSSYSRICVMGDFNSIRASSEQGANRGSEGGEKWWNLINSLKTCK